MNRLITSLFSLPLLLSTGIIHAEIKQYNIEIVMFEDTSDRYINSEQWPVIHHPEEIADGSLKLESDISLLKPQTIESKNQNTNGVLNITHHESDALSKHVSRLNQSARYNVLLHQSWQQAGLSSSDAISIQINTTDLKNTDKDIVPNYQASSMDNQNLQSSIQGTLKLVLGRYLHIHTDLLYKRFNKTEQTLPTLSNTRLFSEFEIKSQRRMRSKELHYIDHPLLGILVLVNPIETLEAEQKNE